MARTTDTKETKAPEISANSLPLSDAEKAFLTADWDTSASAMVRHEQAYVPHNARAYIGKFINENEFDAWEWAVVDIDEIINRLEPGRLMAMQAEGFVIHAKLLDSGTTQRFLMKRPIAYAQKMWELSDKKIVSSLKGEKLGREQHNDMSAFETALGTSEDYAKSLGEVLSGTAEEN